MEFQDIYYKKLEYITTASGNKVCRKSILCGTQNIVLTSKVIVQSDCIIRGDLANVKVGQCSVISKRCILRPSFKKFTKGVAFLPFVIGEHVFVDKDTIVKAAHIGSYVYIGKNCVIGQRSILKDCCLLADNTVLPPETVVPCNTIYSGSPGQCTGDLPFCTEDMMKNFTNAYYQHFLPI